eukprot:11183792-Alexandrium_andersonii.AAC.1
MRVRRRARPSSPPGGAQDEAGVRGLRADSWVAASAIPERPLEGHRVAPSEGSKRGAGYLAADG